MQFVGFSAQRTQLIGIVTITPEQHKAERVDRSEQPTLLGVQPLAGAGNRVHFNTDGYALVVEQAARFATKEFNLDPKTYGG